MEPQLVHKEYLAVVIEIAIIGGPRISRICAGPTNCDKETLHIYFIMVLYLKELLVDVTVMGYDMVIAHMAPEIGVLVPLNRYGSLLLSGKYHYAFTGDSITGGDINHEYWTIGIGYAWRQY